MSLIFHCGTTKTNLLVMVVELVALVLKNGQTGCYSGTLWLIMWKVLHINILHNIHTIYNIYIYISSLVSFNLRSFMNKVQLDIFIKVLGNWMPSYDISFLFIAILRRGQAKIRLKTWEIFHQSLPSKYRWWSFRIVYNHSNFVPRRIRNVSISFYTSIQMKREENMHIEKKKAFTKCEQHLQIITLVHLHIFRLSMPIVHTHHLCMHV